MTSAIDDAGLEADDTVQQESVESEVTPPPHHLRLLPLPFLRPPGTLPESVYISSLASPNSRRTQAARLRTVAHLLGAQDLEDVPWENLRYQHLEAIKARLTETGLSPASINGTLVAIKRVCRAARNLDLMSSREYDLLCEVTPAKGDRLLAGRAMKTRELELMLDTCAADPGPAGLRDAALLSLLYATGLRRDELSRLELDHYDAGTGELRVLHAKGNRQRTAYVRGGTARVLDEWLTLRGRWPGPLFVPVNKSGRLGRTAISHQAVYRIVDKRAGQAGVSDLSPHDFRRTFVSDLLDQGEDLKTVSDLAGHADVSTTARYDRRGEETKQRAIGRRHVPYKGWKREPPPR